MATGRPFFKVHFRCIEKKYTFNTIRQAEDEDSVGHLLNTILDTESDRNDLLIDHVVSGASEESATFITPLETPIKVLQDFGFKCIIVNLVTKKGDSEAKNSVSSKADAFQILMTARRRYDQYPPRRYVIKSFSF